MPELKLDIPKDYLLGLHWAATTGNVGLVKFALDNGTPIDAVLNGYMPLQLACFSDSNLAVVQYLIDRGADVNAQRWSKKHSADKSQAVAGAIGSTALHVACANECIRIVDLLLRNGANVNVTDKYRMRPYDLAAAKNNVEIMRLLEAGGRQQRIQAFTTSSPSESRHSMDVMSSLTPIDIQYLRRPSLPLHLDHNPSQTDVHVASHSPSTLTVSETHTNPLTSIDIRPFPSSCEMPELASSKSSSESTGDEFIRTTSPVSTWSMDNERPDWYGFGVLNHYDDENYLVSLERRAYGLGQSGDDVIRRSHDLRNRTSIESLKRHSSDGGRRWSQMRKSTRAAKDGPAGQDHEPDPQPSITIDDTADTDTFRFVLGKAKSANVQKSLEVAILQPTKASEQRKSLDLRPNLDTLSSLAKRSLDGLSRKSLDIHPGERPFITDSYTTIRRPGFLSRIIDAWSKK